MNPLTAQAIIGLIQALISAAPKIADGVRQAKDLVVALFTAKIVSQEEQDALHAYVDGLSALHDVGIVPDHWKVEPDPQ